MRLIRGINRTGLATVLLVLLIPVAALAEAPASTPTPTATEYAPPTFDEKCPSSEERAKPWGVPLLKPEDLKVPLAFLNVPYPERDAEAVAKNFRIGTWGRSWQHFDAYLDKPPQRAEYPEYRFWPGLFQTLRLVGRTYKSYLFIIDEGCANLTVTRVGVTWRLGLVTGISALRVFDDHDFTRRGLKFDFKYFDGIWPTVVRKLPDDPIPINSLAQSALVAILRHMPGGLTEGNFLALAKEIGEPTGSMSHTNSVTGQKFMGFAYPTPYRPPPASWQTGTLKDWGVSAEVEADGRIYNLFATGPKGTHK
jgi:hypothetical protein